jgi:signal transduction histidine kinase
VATAEHDEYGAGTPMWIRRPGLLHVVAYSLAALVFTGQIAAVLVRGSDLETLLAVLIAGVGVSLSHRLPWVGLVVISAASFAVTEVGQDPLSVWMMAVLVLFSVTLRGKQPVLATVLVAGFFLAAYMTVGGFRGGVVVGVAALFSAVAGGATGAALHVYGEHWRVLAEQARRAIAVQEVEANQRVTAERLRIARDLHDVVGHQVAMLSVHLGVAEIRMPQDSVAARDALVAARSSARGVVVETQRILQLLRRGDDVVSKDALLPTPALDGLSGLITSFESIGLVVESTIERDDVAVSPGVGVTVYRVVQEALMNAHRHGDGVATLVVVEGDGRVRVAVENAISDRFRDSAPSSGLGLMGMRERVDSCGGRLTTESVEGRFLVRAEFDLLGAVLA